MEKQHKVDAPKYVELGKSGLAYSTGMVQEEFIHSLRWPRAGAIYKEMSSNDPVITAILLCAKQLLCGVAWEVEAFDDSSEEQAKAAFLLECMHDMSHTWVDFIDDMSSFLEYGFSYFEIVYKKREGANKDSRRKSKYSDGRIGWRKFGGRAQDTITGWEIDDHGGIVGAYQNWSKDLFIPITHGLLFRTTVKKNNPEGRSVLRGAYRPWYFKKHIEEIEGIGIERDLAGLPVLTAPAGLDVLNPPDDRAKQAVNNALSLVTSIKRDRNEGILLPEGWSLELLSSSSSRTFDTNAIINRYDQRIAMTMLADIVMLGADKVGSFALAKVKQSLLAASLDALLQSVVEVLNTHAVPRLFALNTFKNPQNTPRIKVSPVVAPDIVELGAYIRNLSSSRMPLFPDIDLENALRRAANLPEISAEDSEEREKVLENAEESTETRGRPTEYDKNGNPNKTDKKEDKTVKEED